MLNDFHGADHIYIKCGRTDLRMGIDGFAALVKQEMELDHFNNSRFRLILCVPSVGIAYAASTTAGAHVRRWQGRLMPLEIGFPTDRDGIHATHGAHNISADRETVEKGISLIMHIDNVIFLSLSKFAYTRFSEGPLVSRSPSENGILL